MNSRSRLNILIPELPARLLASVTLVAICCGTYLAFPMFQRSPQLFAGFEVLVLGIGIWAFHAWYHQKPKPGVSARSSAHSLLRSTGHLTPHPPLPGKS
jgi:hypothetical protein